MVSHRYAKANNVYLPTYVPSLPNSYIIYLDANNLYGWAMLQNLPTHDFSWTDEYVNCTNVPDDSDIGCIFEIDLEYPDELHDLHNCYPLAPEKIEVLVSECFPYTKNIAKEFSILKSKYVEKLVPNLRNKTKYVLHHRNLKLIDEVMQEPQKEFENSNAEDLKSVIPNDDSKEVLGFIKQETSAEMLNKK
ncbi:uncharacterized protein NPIL_234081 [Nephila pilipes]|uniref:DNA-directed DNA polymerase n=1 Tax=Nephila pilipes TaxID=299642 RepID=A0A8X6PS74_NEPPI|nr:uncharacterized protein NPIL_234081 [Nephila pilipes]